MAVPEFRLSGFEGEWESRAFNDVVDRKSTIVTDRSLPSVEYDDIVSGFGVLRTDLAKKSRAKAGIQFEIGDVLYGKLRPYLKNWLLPSFPGIAIGDFWVLSGKSTPAEFLYALIQTEHFSAVSNTSSGSKMPRADWGLVSKTEFRFPPSLGEQRAIGRFFDGLDTVLENQQTRLTQLRRLKETMLSKMFPRAGESVPEIRFDGFEGEWEGTELGDAVHMYQPVTISGSEFTDSGVPVFGANGYIGYYSEANHTDDQVTICARGALTGWPSYVKGPVWITGNSMVISPSGARVQKRYLYTALCSNVELIMSYSTGGAQPQLTREVLRTVPFTFPSLVEQRAIGSYFAKLDRLIELEHAKLAKFQQLKAAFLINMFV